MSLSQPRPHPLPLCRSMRAVALHPQRRPQRSGVRAVIRCAMPGELRGAGMAEPTRRSATSALNRAHKKVTGVGDYAGQDGTRWLIVQPARTVAATGAPARAATSGRPRGGLGRRAARILATGWLGWLPAIACRLGDWLFTMNDAEANWRSWQITREHGGLGRRYRDLQFDTLAACPKCRGSGGTADLSCPACRGTGLATLGGVS